MVLVSHVSYSALGAPALSALCGLSLILVQQFIKLSWSRYQEATDNSTRFSKQIPAVRLHLQHLLLTDVMFSDIVSWITCIIYSCAPSSPRLQDNHIFRFYTGLHSDFWLKGYWNKGVFADVLHIHHKFGLHCCADVCLHVFEKSHQAKHHSMLCLSRELWSNLESRYSLWFATLQPHSLYASLPLQEVLFWLYTLQAL